LVNVYSLTRFESTLALRGRKSKAPDTRNRLRRLSGLESMHLTGHPPAGATNALEQGFSMGGTGLEPVTPSLSSKANYFEVETGEEYWISGCKEDGSDPSLRRAESGRDRRRRPR
jgi:hypothetical protein